MKVSLRFVLRNFVLSSFIVLLVPISTYAKVCESQIVLSQQTQQLRTIKTLQCDGENQKTVFSAERDIRSPSMSPSGTTLYLESLENNNFGVYRVDLGTQIKRLERLTPKQRSDKYFSLSRSSPLRILAMTYHDQPDTNDLKCGLISFAPDTPAQPVMETEMTCGLLFPFDRYPQFSYSGNSLFFDSNRHFTPQNTGQNVDYKNFDVYQRTAQGDIKRLTFAEGHDILPSPSPDGSQLVFNRRPENAYHIALFDIESKAVSMLTSGENNYWGPKFDRTGKFVFFLGSENDQVDLFRFEIASRTLINITNTKEEEVSFSLW